MNQNKKGSANNLTCDVCKIDFNSNADYALHEFSKKHCDNLIRLAKQKPVVSKQKTKNENSQVEKESPKVCSVTHAGSFAKYGYFVPGEIYANSETSKEFNTDYDPYLQKFAENPFKEKPNYPIPVESSTFSSITSFSKKKKKKIKTCQVCNVVLATVPEYEAHMKSPQHIWKLKVTGMGVSAHFVKASTDLHTTDINEEPKISNNMDNQVPAASTVENENSPSGPFPLLYCSDCELLLNSPQQYSEHINGKFHIECAQRKAELKAKKEKLQNPSPNQLYCYSCKISLNNLFQYNEHKNGKKHKTKCRNLTRKGITIPLEERVPGIPLPNPNKPVIYPELYEKLVLDKQKKEESESGQFIALQENNEKQNLDIVTEPQSFSLNSQSESNINFQENSGIPTDDTGNSNYPIKMYNNLEVYSENNSVSESRENCSELFEAPKIIFYKNGTTPEIKAPILNHQNSVLDIGDSLRSISNSQNDSSGVADKTAEKEELKSKVRIIPDNLPIKCSICSESFQWQSLLDAHLNTEDHMKKILELKLKGSSDHEILNAIFSDRNAVKPNNLGKLTCGICNITTESNVEFDQHLNSIVHKYTQKDYKMKRTLEVKYIISSNEQGLYFCKLCKEGWPSLMDYIQHLHFAKHKSIQRAQRAKLVLAKRRTSCIQKQRLMQGLKKKNTALRRVKTEKNPGVRTKVCGVAVDLHSGTKAPVPNLEPLEPKIDMTKNVSIGVCEKPNESTASSNINDKIKISGVKKRCNVLRSNRKLHSSVTNQFGNKSCSNDLLPLMPSGNPIPPLIPGPPFQPRFPRPSYVPPHRNWINYSNPYPTVFDSFCNRPPLGSSYFRPPYLPRSPWFRYR